MNAKTLVLVLLLIGVFLVGCTSSQPDYTTYYKQQQNQQQGQYVGGGCGVAPSGDYRNTLIETQLVNSAL